MSIEVLDDPEKIQSYISKCKESRKDKTKPNCYINTKVQ